MHLLHLPTPYRWLVTLVFVALVVALSVTPARAQRRRSIFKSLVINTPPPVQKAMHVGAYATLAVLWIWTLDAIDSRASRLLASLVLTVSLGAILEWYQTTVPGRFGTLTDVLLNIGGAVMGLLLAIALL